MRSRSGREAEGQSTRGFNCDCRRTVGSRSADLGFGKAQVFLGENIDREVKKLA